ncbi:22186_t:CDS:2 [Cetraspora pellucida]|uniref:22186_t:CDS:1 n=1 Tax=Cetraspora pellucida TaxID=1433469 RepID=A0A9N9ISH4_9GLOM|nr:22186_t:CDS:2 [Cetraspora pellucida]
MSADNNVPASKFVPLLREIVDVTDQITEVYQNIKHSRRICGLLIVKIQAARTSLISLEICANEFPESTDFFTRDNSTNLRNLKLFMRKIEEFIRKFQDIHNYGLFFDQDSIRNEFDDLFNEFDRYFELLKFSISIKINDQQSINNIDLINKDIEEMKERNKGAFDMPKKQDLLHKEISSNASLKPDDFIIDEDTPIRGKVQKYHYNPFGEDVALKKLDLKENKQNIQQNTLDLQIGILKTINESRDIIKYFGLVTINSQQFLVTEWAEYGTLREYYQNKSPDITIRARLALEIARGLNYLSAYEIYHHDVRSENILVDHLARAKITNFELSRSFSEAVSKNIDLSMENVRYMAPEKIKDSTKRYNLKCEVFSYGMLLWELAEQKVPFSETGFTVLAISQLILDRAMNLKFLSHDVPEQWKSLVFEATQYKAKDRPEMKEILRKIRIINESINTAALDASESNDDDLSNDDDDLSFEEAVEQTSLKSGSKERAWKTIVKFSEIDNDYTAKYWKGYYLFNKLINFPYSDDERMQLAADAFKEAADGANHRDAQFMYASCIYKKNPYEAIEYFGKAATQQHTAAMHNLGLLYYNGKLIKVDKEKGKEWFRRAADGNLEASINFCKKNGIKFK